MTTIRFTKGQATGNDFVLVADPEGASPLWPAQVRALCDRHFGVGADGVIRAVRSAHLPAGASVLAEDPAAEWFMDYANADGSIAEMCGNGVRAYVRFLMDTGLVSLGVGETIAIGTRAGVKRVERVTEDAFRIDMGGWRLAGAEPLVAATGLEVDRPGLGVDVGNPHVVVALSSNDELEALELGRAPVLDPPAPDGANVEFVVPADPLVLDGVGRIRMRVSERGVGETMSCGTGAVAAALAVRHWAGAGAPDRWSVGVPGGVVEVTMSGGPDERVTLAGPAELVFDGELTLPGA